MDLAASYSKRRAVVVVAVGALIVVAITYVISPEFVQQVARQILDLSPPGVIYGVLR